MTDTLAPFVGLASDAENDAAAAMAAMAPLQAAAQTHDLAILVARHDRKGSGEIGESGRGSNAWTGAVDCVMALRRQANPVRPTLREIEAISRRNDVPAEPLVIELTEAGYIALGSEGAVAFTEARAAILRCLSDERDGVSVGQTIDDLSEATGLNRSTIRDAARALVREGTIERTGRGVAGDPYRYAKGPGSGLSDGRLTYGKSVPPSDKTPADHGSAVASQEELSAVAFGRYLDSAEGQAPARPGSH